MASAPMAVEHDRSHVQRRRVGNILLHSGIVLICAITIFPFLWMLSTAFKPSDEVFTRDLRLIANDPTWRNFPDAFNYFPVAQWLWNSFGISTITTAGKVAISLPAAYAFARLRFRGDKLLFAMVLATMIVPGILTVVSLTNY